MKKFLSLALLIFCATSFNAQNFMLPDSAAVVKNKVQVARIYFVGNDGSRHMSQYLLYDKKGRIIRESENEKSYYYAYGYDEKNRLTSATQRSAKGDFTQKFTYEYLQNDSLKKVSLYQSYDTTFPTHVYFYDLQENKIREEAYNNKVLVHLSIITYNASGDVSYSYDSVPNSVSERIETRLVKIRSYSPKGELLHRYEYRYGPFGVTEITDSISRKEVTRYKIIYSGYGQVKSAERDGKTLPDVELNNFKNDFRYVLPATDEREDYGLPVPDVINTHNITRDKKGNITRDELTQKQGSFSETYVYEYEYEFY